MRLTSYSTVHPNLCHFSHVLSKIPRPLLDHSIIEVSRETGVVMSSSIGTHVKHEAMGRGSPMTTNETDPSSVIMVCQRKRVREKREGGKG